jgi:hypothetical protein
MKDKFLKDLPIFINGLAVGSLLFGIPNIGLMDISMYVLAMISFFWYGRTQRTIE